MRTRKANKYNKRTKKAGKRGFRKTKKMRGGETAEEKKFRRGLMNSIIQIKHKKDVKKGINNIISLFQLYSEIINTKILVDARGNPIDKSTYSSAKKPRVVVDTVSPVIVIFDNLSNAISQTDLKKIIDAYIHSGGDINSESSRFKKTPFINEIEKGRMDNVRLLLSYLQGADPSISMFQADGTQIQDIDDDSEDDESENADVGETIGNVQQQSPLPYVKLDFSLPLPPPDTGYDIGEPPEFWKTIFEPSVGTDLISIRNMFTEKFAKFYVEKKGSISEICDVLVKIFPDYHPRMTLKDHRESAKTLINTNILNCFITILYGIIAYRLFDSKQDYALIFKGGRAIQLAISSVEGTKDSYISDDTDVLIVPIGGASYNEDEMRKLSSHIGYLVKWFIPEIRDFRVVVGLPGSEYNKNTEITKVAYNDGPVYVALSDIGFGRVNEAVKRFFDYNNFVYPTPVYLYKFETQALFVIPSLDDMLSEKLYYYAYYFKEQQKSNLSYADRETNGKYLYKFNKALKSIIPAIILRDKKPTNYKLELLRTTMQQFPEYQGNPEEIEAIIRNI